MDGDAGAVLDRHQLLELDVEAIRDRKRVRGDERIAPVKLAPFDARQAERDALARGCSLDGRIVHLHRPHTYLAPTWRDPQRVALRDRSRPQRSRRDGADSTEREDAIDVEPSKAVHIA